MVEVNPDGKQKYSMDGYLKSNLDFAKNAVKKDLDICDKICDTTRYKSSKMIFSKGKQYSSKAALRENSPTHDDEKIIDSKCFWEESQYMKLYNIHDKKDTKD